MPTMSLDPLTPPRAAQKTFLFGIAFVFNLPAAVVVVVAVILPPAAVQKIKWRETGMVLGTERRGCAFVGLCREKQ